MSDHACCATETAPSPAKLSCPACGRPGKRVPEETPAALVRPEAAGEVVAGARYRFCATPGCAIAYYPDPVGPAPIEVSALRVPVGQKGMGDPLPLCYCFHFSEADVVVRAAAGDEPVSAVVKRQMKDPGCACATENPSGSCCLGNIRAAEKRLAGAAGGETPVDAPDLTLDDRPSEAPLLATSGSGRGGLVGALAVVPGIGAALLPAVACPACWPAYAGLLSSLGIGFVNYTPYLGPLMVLFLAIALVTLALQGRRRGSYGPLLLGTLGSAALLAGRFALASDPLTYAGIVALVAASAWNAWPRRATACAVSPGGTGCGCER